MRIHKIKGHNFLSFDDFEITINDNVNNPPSLWIIDGINYDTDSDDSSNGSGKSTIISESVFYNLFSRGLRGIRQKVKQDSMIKNGREQLINEVEYFIENEDDEESILNIQRIKKNEGGASVNVSIDGESKTKRTKRLSDKDIKMFIDLSADVFSQVVVYYRDNINLLGMNYGQRLDFFKNIINLTIIDDYYAKFKTFKNKNDNKLNELNLAYKNIIEIIDIISKNKEKYNDFINEKIEDVKVKLSELENLEINNCDDLLDDKKKLNAELQDLTSKLNDISSKIIFDNKSISKVKDEVKKLNSVSGGVCPTCHQNVEKQYVDSVTKGYQDEILKFETNIAKYEESKKVYSEQIKNIKTKIDKLEIDINKVKSANLIRQNTIDNYKKELNRLMRDLTEQKNNDDEISKLDLYEKKKIGFGRAIKIREKWNEAATYWYDAFAPKSLLRSVIIRKYITLLSDTFEYYISKLYNNEIIGKITIDDDGNIDISLFKDNFETNYWQLSSGERKRIDIALLLSLYEFTSYMNKNMVRFLILDECLDNLDGYGRECVINTLVDVQKRHKIDLFLISHTEIPLDNIPDDVIIKRILVTKKNKNSEVRILEDEERN